MPRLNDLGIRTAGAGPKDVCMVAQRQGCSRAWREQRLNFSHTDYQYINNARKAAFKHNLLATCFRSSEFTPASLLKCRTSAIAESMILVTKYDASSSHYGR